MELGVISTAVTTPVKANDTTGKIGFSNRRCLDPDFSEAPAAAESVVILVGVGGDHLLDLLATIEVKGLPLVLVH